MKEAMPKDGAMLAAQRENARRLRKWTARHCAICTRRIWLDPVRLMEPEGAPEPHLSWTVCKSCHQALLNEMRRSPVRSPLRLRIAMGIVASERWPMAYPARVHTTVSDRRWIVLIAVGFVIAMIVHLALIVLIAGLR